MGVDEGVLPGAKEPQSASSTRAPMSVGDMSPVKSSQSPALPIPSHAVVLMHGEAQTSAGKFRKKKEYLVLTEIAVMRYKSQSRAADAFKSVPASNLPSAATPTTPRHAIPKHASLPSIGSSAADLPTLADTSSDKDGRISLRHIVAVYVPRDDGKAQAALEICSLEESTGTATATLLQFSMAQERDAWLNALRAAVKAVRWGPAGRTDAETTSAAAADISPASLETVARAMESDHDYDPDHCAIYKVALRTSPDEVAKSGVVTTVFFLAIGLNKLHMIPLSKSTGIPSNPSTASPSTASFSTSNVAILASGSFGILTLSALRVSASDDTFELVFRRPLQRPRILHLAACASSEIAARIIDAEAFLRPMCCHRLYKLSAPSTVNDLVGSQPYLSGSAAASLAHMGTHNDDHGALDRTLAAYCIAYGLDPTTIRYAIDYNCEDAPRFELRTPDQTGRESSRQLASYSPIALLAVMRALRYNESFGSISFAGVSLDSLHGLHDHNGTEYVCTRTVYGDSMHVTPKQLHAASLLVQEVRALAALSRKLRRLDFSDCFTNSPSAVSSSRPMALTRPHDSNANAYMHVQSSTTDRGCGIPEALYPLCVHQTTNVDWLVLNGISLSETDLDYIVATAADRSSHLRALELARCGLTDRQSALLLDALRSHENTLEALALAAQPPVAARSATAIAASPTFLDPRPLAAFSFLRRLDLSYVAPRSFAGASLGRTTTGINPDAEGEDSEAPQVDAFLSAAMLCNWRLQDLRLSGCPLNRASITAMAQYLRHPRSSGLRVLALDGCVGLDAHGLATIVEAMAQGSGLEINAAREIHLDASYTRMHPTTAVKSLAHALSLPGGPTSLTLRGLEFGSEVDLRVVLLALAKNTALQVLDLAALGLPAAAPASPATADALARLIADSPNLEVLDFSGEDSRLDRARFGPRLPAALAAGLRANWMRNGRLRVLRCEHQRLGFAGAEALARVIRAQAQPSSDSKFGHTLSEEVDVSPGLRELWCAGNLIPFAGFAALVDAAAANPRLVYLPATMDDGRQAELKRLAADTENAARSSHGPVKLAPHAAVNSSTTVTTATAASAAVKRGLSSVRRSSHRLSSYGPKDTISRKGSMDILSSTSSADLKSLPDRPPALKLPTVDSTSAQPALSQKWDAQSRRLARILRRNWEKANGYMSADAATDEEEEECLRGTTGGESGELEQLEYFGISTSASVEGGLQDGATGLVSDSEEVLDEDGDVDDDGDDSGLEMPQRPSSKAQLLLDDALANGPISSSAVLRTSTDDAAGPITILPNMPPTPESAPEADVNNDEDDDNEDDEGRIDEESSSSEDHQGKEITAGQRPSSRHSAAAATAAAISISKARAAQRPIRERFFDAEEHVSFKQFLLESGPRTPPSENLLAKQLALQTKVAGAVV